MKQTPGQPGADPAAAPSEGKRAAAAASEQARKKHDHDWHSPEYVSHWIERDRARGESRRVLLQRTIAAIPYPRDAKLSAIDVGGGYGAVSKELLAAYGNAEVTLHDYSQVMFAQARHNLAEYADRVRYVEADLRDRSWTGKVGGPFDLALSAIAIHNIMDMAIIAACYREVGSLLKPGGWFIDYDHYDHISDIETHIKLFKQAGYAQVQCVWYESPTGIIRARA